MRVSSLFTLGFSAITLLVCAAGIAARGWSPILLLSAAVLFLIVWVARWQRDSLMPVQESRPGRERLYQLFEPAIQKKVRHSRPDAPVSSTRQQTPHFGAGFFVPQGDPLTDPPPPPPEAGTLRWSLLTLGIDPVELEEGSLTHEYINQNYRERSRVAHPDRLSQADSAALQVAHAQMADLNLAKAVLLKAIHDER